MSQFDQQRDNWIPYQAYEPFDEDVASTADESADSVPTDTA